MIDARDRYPTLCESENHHDGCCWGYLRKCPVCGYLVCYEDGAADVVDDELPGICDTCAMLIEGDAQ